MRLTHKSESNLISFLADSELLIMGISLWISIIVLSGITIIVCLNDLDIISAFIVFSMDMLISCSFLFLLPKWRIVVELNNEGICYKPTFKKKVVKKYSDFGYFYCASYTYYTQKKYIVFSQRRLSDYELTHINNVPVSDKLIKIKVRKGLKEVLSPILPPKYLFRIPKDFW